MVDHGATLDLPDTVPLLLKMEKSSLSFTISLGWQQIMLLNTAD
jgi:hypothetical protein